MPVTLSLVVPATDGPPTLPMCLAAVARAEHPPGEVIAVTGPATLSASTARNLGGARARGDVIVFVDADVEVHIDAFTRIRAALDADPALTAVHGSYDDAPGARTTVSAFRNLLHHHVHQQAAGEAETFWTGIGAVRRSAFDTAGGFDGVRYPHPSIEDIELGQRLVARGGRLRLDPAIQGTHLKRWTLRSMVRTDFARRGVPWVALQVRTRRLARTLNMGWRHRASALLCLVLSVAVLAGLPVAVGATVMALVGLNRTFYGLLVRRLGVLQGIVGMALHWLHHLIAVAAVPVGVLAAVTAALRDGPEVERHPEVLPESGTVHA
jgi:GT2 family glycosyltransferase